MFKKVVLILIGLGVPATAATYLWRQHHAPFYYAGTIEATKVDVPSRLASVIDKINVGEGDRVVKNAPLVLLACEDLKIQSSHAGANYARAVKLRAAGSMPQETFDETKFRRDDLALKLDWCTVRSPLAGSVLTRYREPGEWVSPGTKLMTLANLAEVWAYVYVPLPVMAGLKVGEKVTAFIPELAMRQMEGVLEKVNDQAEFTPKNVQTREERTRLVYGIKVRFQNDQDLLKPGMSVEVSLPE